MISAWAIRLFGLIVAVVGLLLFLAAVELEMGVHIPVIWWIEGLVGLVLIGIGAFIIQGGKVTL